MKDKTIKALSIVAILFGGLTVFSGWRALFGSAEAQAAVGNAVGFVLWFNFLAGFVYVAVGAALLRQWPWGARAAMGLAVATALLAMAFIWHVMAGGAYEARTAAALTLRLVFWLALAALSWNKRIIK